MSTVRPRRDRVEGPNVLTVGRGWVARGFSSAADGRVATSWMTTLGHREPKTRESYEFDLEPAAYEPLRASATSRAASSGSASGP